MTQRSLKSIENEIVYQILISEICFDICRSIPTIPGHGNDFLPFYYNLNFSKGIISLHGLLLSNHKNELSVKNYIKEHKYNYPSEDISEFDQKIATISESFKKSYQCHYDTKFAHILMKSLITLILPVRT